MMPGNATERMDPTTYKSRTTVGLQPSQLAMPPQTPPNMRLWRERCKGLEDMTVAANSGLLWLLGPTLKRGL